MSILVESECLFPEDLLEREDPTGLNHAGPDGPEPDDASAERAWWVLYTKSRQEKALANQLLAAQVPFYLPLITKTSWCRGRKFQARVPVFSNYVFLFGTAEERVRSLQTNRISRVLQVLDAKRLRADLRQLRRLINTGAPLTIEKRLLPGQRVRVRNGPFAGMEGTILKRHGKAWLIVSVDFIQQGACVAVEDFRVEPISY